jgi:hypothetical protein
MKAALLMQAAGAALVLSTGMSAANAQDGSGRDDRLSLMVAGHKLTNTDGGWGAAAVWLHNFSANTLIGLGGETQTIKSDISDARWSFGRLSFNHGTGAAETRTNLYFDAAVGSGHDDLHNYDYTIVTAGMYQNLTRQLTLQLEDKQVDVDTARGNLPKLGVQYLWSPYFSTSVGYAYSVSGTLDTRLATGRVDAYLKTVNLFAGLANGQAAPVVTGLPPGTPVPGFILHQYYVGVARPFSRADLTTVLDYQRLGNSNHWTLTFNAMLHKRTDAR